MTTEYVRYRLKPGVSTEFETAYRQGALVLRTSPYCRTVELTRCTEDENVYVLRIVWTSASDHLEGFRTSERFAEFVAAIGPYVSMIEEMRHYEPVAVLPSLYDWAGGAPAFERLFAVFYDRVRVDEVLAEVFASMDPAHPEHVALWLGEVFGGPPDYSRRRGGHGAMVSQHAGRALTERQRRRWFDLLLDCADAVGLPADPEFRAAFVGYLEWGTRLAVQFSAPGAATAVPEPMPSWGWGELRPWA